MSAKHVVNPKQLAMFMRAGDIVGNVVPLEGDRQEVYLPNERGDWYYRNETDQQLWDRKVEESKLLSAKGGALRKGNQKSLYNSIAEEGVSVPVRIAHHQTRRSRVAQGHHRIAAANAADPDMLIPVEHYDIDHEGGIGNITFRPGEENNWEANDWSSADIDRFDKRVRERIVGAHLEKMRKNKNG